MVAEYIEALANQFGGKNSDFYGGTTKNAKNDEIFPKFAAELGLLRVTVRHEAVQRTSSTLDCFVVPPHNDAKRVKNND